MSNAVVFRAKDIDKERNFEIARDRRKKRTLRWEAVMVPVFSELDSLKPSPSEFPRSPFLLQQVPLWLDEVKNVGNCQL